MADTIQFDLVSPERKLASLAATAVTIPGVAGDMTAMPNHAAFLTTLRPGFVTVTGAGAVTEYFVTGGFAEISAEAVSILAEEAIERSALTRDRLDGLVGQAETALSTASEDMRAAVALRLNDLRQITL